MPHYQFIHTIPLTKSQKDRIAKEVTELHCTTFPLTPKFFVNIFFQHTDGESGYCGGRSSHTNRMIGHVRVSSARSQQDYNDLAAGISKIWETVVFDSSPHSSNEAAMKTKDQEEEKSRRKKAEIRVWIIGAILAGKEGDMFLPKAGEERAWLEEVMPGIRRIALDGDEEYLAMVEDIESRRLVGNSERGA